MTWRSARLDANQNAQGTGRAQYIKFAPWHAAEVEFSLKSRMKKAEPLADPA